MPVVTEPGKNFSYSNEAVALLPGIVLAASGKNLDIYLRDWLLKQLGILDYKWDRGVAGNVMACGGPWLFPRDLAPIGQLMMDSGRWKKKQLVPAKWVRACSMPARPDIPDYGLLWWLYPARMDSPPALEDTAALAGWAIPGNLSRTALGRSTAARS